MGLIRVKTEKECYEQKGYWAYVDGVREFHATSGKYPCGTWRIDPETGQPPVSVNPKRVISQKEAFARGVEPSSDEKYMDGVVSNPLNLVSENESRSRLDGLADRTAPVIYDAFEGSEENIIAENALFDEDGNEQKEDSDSQQSGGFKLPSNPAYYVVAAVVALYLFRKRLGFG
jgi:hypothetical protein